jgi:hypothetical protein
VSLIRRSDFFDIVERLQAGGIVVETDEDALGAAETGRTAAMFRVSVAVVRNSLWRCLHEAKEDPEAQRKRLGGGHKPPGVLMVKGPMDQISGRAPDLLRRMLRFAPQQEM